MMELSPLFLLAALLIGYPAIQIVAIRLRRTARLGLRSLYDAMIVSFPDDRSPERYALDEMMRSSRGDLLMLLTPIMLPVIALVEIVRGPPKLPSRFRSNVRERAAMMFEAFGCVPETSAIWDDPRLPKALTKANNLAFVSWPITLAVAFVLSGPLFAIAFIMEAIKSQTVQLASVRIPFDQLRRIYQTLAHS